MLLVPNSLFEGISTWREVDISQSMDLSKRKKKYLIIHFGANISYISTKWNKLLTFYWWILYPTLKSVALSSSCKKVNMVSSKDYCRQKAKTWSCRGWFKDWPLKQRSVWPPKIQVIVSITIKPNLSSA